MAGSAADVAASLKEQNYAELNSCYLFEPTVVETLDVFNSSANSSLKEIGLRISLNHGGAEGGLFLYQCISVLVQRFKSIL